MPFGPEEDILLGLPLEVDALHQLRGSLPFVQGVHFRGLSGLVIVQISKGSESDAMKVMEPLFSNFYIKVVVVTDGDVDIWNPKEVGWALSRVRFNKDLVVRSDLPGCMVDPSAIAPGIHPVEFIPMITKVGIDATKPLAELDRFEKIDVPASVKEKIAATLRGLV
jgi:2,5-furandicarboxylate decarboxylase 1